MPPIKVISLARSLERRAEFQRINAHVPYDFFDAVDGAKLSFEEIDSSGHFKPGLTYTTGAYGCALSHITLWNQVMETGRPLTIVEDDAILRHDFVTAHDRLLANAGPDWDYVLWGWNFDSFLSLNVMRGVSSNLMQFDQQKLREAADMFQHSYDVPVLLPLEKAFGIVAYSISPKGAQKFSTLCLPLGNFAYRIELIARSFTNTGIDSAMNRIYPITNSQVCFPPLAVTPNVHATSTVQNEKPGNMWRG